MLCVGVHNSHPRSLGTFCLPPGHEGWHWHCSAVSPCSALSPAHGSHEMASAAGSCCHTRWLPLLHTGPVTAAAQAEQSQSCSGYPSLPRIEEGDGILTAHLCDRHAWLLHSPSWPLQLCRQAVLPGAPSTPPANPLCSGGSPASKVLYPSTDIPCHRPRSHCHGCRLGLMSLALLPSPLP